MFWHPSISPDSEPRRVGITRGEWVDPARQGRVVPWKIYRPESALTEGPWPVIIWSHGLGGSREGAGFISRFVASYGYVIVHIQHVGTDTSLWEGKPGHPWDVIRATPIPRKMTLQRYRDVPFVVAQLQALQDPAFDMARLGMSGHSFGAQTTQIMAGQAIVRGQRHYRLRMPEFRAGILYSPMPGRGEVQNPAQAYGGIAMPLLHFTGTDDESPLGGFPYQNRLQVFEQAGASDQYLVVLRGGDHMVFNGSRGQLGDNPARPRHEDIIKILSLAWWDTYLKGDAAAQAWLMNGGATAFLGGDATQNWK